jgi:hypothetical protein
MEGIKIEVILISIVRSFTVGLRRELHNYIKIPNNINKSNIDSYLAGL